MTWLRVSKLHIPSGYEPFDLNFPVEARRLIKFLIDNGLLYYQRYKIPGGMLSIGRFNAEEDWYNLERVVQSNPDYILRKQHFEKFNVRYENLYFGIEDNYDPAVTGISIPDKDFQKVTSQNVDGTIGYLIDLGKY